MNTTGRRDIQAHKTKEEVVEPGATKQAMDEVNNGGGPAGSPIGDRHADGQPAGGGETGGIAGSNIGEGRPFEDESEWQAPLGDANGPYSGHAGGAVGGTPAQGRAVGGTVQGGFSPGSGDTRGDSTIGSDPEPESKHRHSKGS